MQRSLMSLIQMGVCKSVLFYSQIIGTVLLTTIIRSSLINDLDEQGKDKRLIKVHTIRESQ